MAADLPQEKKVGRSKCSGLTLCPEQSLAQKHGAICFWRRIRTAGREEVVIA